MVEFLSNKFTNAELYEWMSRVLEEVYSFFLQQATAMAQLALQQLAFERQEVPPPFIQADYWEPPSEGMGGGKAVDRRGLTGSARLLRDIHQLDQYAFETTKRKLELTKTLSLASLGPAEFQRFRETGVLRFGTTMEMFDRDFPGHYLRLIKRVRVSFVALIPPAMGVRATLETTGLSRVVVGGDTFQKVVVDAGPQRVALSSPREATGRFELEQQAPSDLLLPFEGLGVETNWELRLPKAANPFDYRTIADVLVTIEYTALESWDYAQEVLQSPALTRPQSLERAYSFRNDLPDAWYDLTHPTDSPTPMKVIFRSRREDFSPNLSNLKIQHVVLYFGGPPPAEGMERDDIFVSGLTFTPDAGDGPLGGSATAREGLASTRTGTAGSWLDMVGAPPIGEWTLALPDTPLMRKKFASGEIEDVLLVVTYSGWPPAWPN